MKRSIAALLAWLAVACTAGAAWLYASGDGADEPSLPAVRVLLIDASASVRSQRGLSWIPWVRGRLAAEAEAALKAGEELAVVRFADEVQRVFGPGPPESFLALLHGVAGEPFDPRVDSQAELASRLAEALRVGVELGVGPDRKSGRLVLLGDGQWTDGDPLPELARARGFGLGLAWYPAPPAEFADLAAVSIEVPPGIEEGAPLVARARLRFDPGRESVAGAVLFIDVDGPTGIYTTSVEVDLPARRVASVFEVPLDLGVVASGRTELTLRAVLSPGPSDAVPSNDHATTAFVAGDELIVGVVASDLERARDWLAPAGSAALVGVQFLFLEPRELAPELERLDALFTIDLPLERLPELPLEDFVRRGGGWFATAGWNFLHDFARGRNGRLHALLPVEPAPHDQGPREVVLLVDGSGSMEGEPFEMVRAACLELVAASLPEDRVSLRFFTGALGREYPVKDPEGGSAGGESAGVLAARQLLAAHVPGGTTHILRSLEIFAGLRAKSRARGLVLLLTDGREQDTILEPAKRTGELLAALAAARTHMVVIGVGDSLDYDYLEMLTSEGDEPMRAENQGDLERIFRREVSGATWREGNFAVTAVSGQPDSLFADVFRSSPGGALPPVRRVVRNVVRPEAEVFWVTDEAPLLSLQRVGQGRTAFFASAPLEGWAPGWVGAPGLGEPRLFASLVRWLGRGTRGRSSGPRLSARPGRLRLDGLPAGTPAEFSGRLFDAAALQRSAGRSGQPLGELRFSLADPEGGDLQGAREASLTGEEIRLLRTPGHWLEWEEPGPLGGTLTHVPVVPLAEFAAVGSTLRPGDWQAEPALQAPTRGISGDGCAPLVLFLGLVSLGAAACYLVFSNRPVDQGGQGIGADDR